MGDIAFDDLSYKYGFGRDTLTDINLTIKQGDKVSLVGVSGSGKTTLAKMIVNFFEPYKGHISINHQDIKNMIKKSCAVILITYPNKPISLMALSWKI